MEKLQIKIDQLKNYLGTELKIRVLDNSSWNVSNMSLIPIHLTDKFQIQFIQCYRLSDLDKFIPELGFVPLDELKTIWAGFGANDSELMFDSVYFEIKVPQPGCDYIGERDDSSCWIAVSNSFEIYQKLFQWHFWPFGDEYFEAGLVIDKLKMTEK